jgi:hypothetical protein
MQASCSRHALLSSPFGSRPSAPRCCYLEHGFLTPESPIGLALRYPYPAQPLETQPLTQVGSATAKVASIYEVPLCFSHAFLSVSRTPAQLLGPPSGKAGLAPRPKKQCQPVSRCPASSVGGALKYDTWGRVHPKLCVRGGHPPAGWISRYSGMQRSRPYSSNHSSHGDEFRAPCHPDPSSW